MATLPLLLLLGLQKAAFSLDVSAFERFFFYKVVSAPPSAAASKNLTKYKKGSY